MLIIIAYNFIFRNRLAATFSLSKEKSDNFTVLPLKIFDKLKKMCYSIIAFERAINAWLQKYPRGSRGSPAKGVVWDNRSTSSNLVFCAKKRLRIGYNSESFSTKSTFSGGINRIYEEIPHAWDEIRLDGGWVDLISSKLGLDFICHRQISSRSDFMIAFLSDLCYT